MLMQCFEGTVHPKILMLLQICMVKKRERFRRCNVKNRAHFLIVKEFSIYLPVFYILHFVVLCSCIYSVSNHRSYY